jgi:ABC-type transport system involved in multi-copper enzyme maturation permease subunit
VKHVDVPPLRPLQGFPVLFGWGLRRTLRAKKFLWVGVFGVLAFYGLGMLLRATRDPTRALFHVMDVPVLGMTMPLLALILVGGGFGEEVQDRTLLFHLVRPVRRSTLYHARFAAGLVPGAIVGAAMVAAICVGNGAPIGTGTIVALSACAALGVATLGALYYAIAALFRRGLIAGLVYTFLLEGLFQFLPGSIQKLSLTFHVRSLAHRLTDDAFATASQGVGASLERHAQQTQASPEQMLKAAIREPWTQVSTVWIICAVVILGASLLGARAVTRKDFALKD